MFNIRQLTTWNLVFYQRHYQLVAIAVCIVVAVIIGSLAVGHSVRETLKQRVEQRLGDTETIVLSRQSYFSERLLRLPIFGKSARGVLMTDGFISSDDRLLPVMVWGVDENTERGSSEVNAALSAELKGIHELTLRLPHQGVVPTGSLFVTKNYTTSLRLTVDGIRTVEEGGNINLKNEQVFPMNIFVNREELAEAMGAEGMLNLILSPQLVNKEDVEKTWDAAMSGIELKEKQDEWHLTSKRVFLQESIVKSLIEQDTLANPLFTYLANGIVANGKSIPYSFVTAVRAYKGRPLANDEIILSDYSARRLNAQTGDEVSISYFLANDLKNLRTDSISLRVSQIVPLSEWVNDGELSADFPGLSDVERCSDWDSDLPIDMSLIEKEDEAYWEKYKNLPKALLPYGVMADRWYNSWGSATAIRFAHQPDLGTLSLGMMGIEVLHPKEKGLLAAAHGTDFAGLFLALGFFIILAALLLMFNPLSEMYEERREERYLLKALGFTDLRISRLWVRELIPVVLSSSFAGIIVGILYSALIIWLLGNLWQGATGTYGFSVHLNGFLIMVGWLISIIIIAIIGWYAIREAVKEKEPAGKPLFHNGKWKQWCLILLSVLIVVFLLSNFLFLGRSIMLFVLTGILLLFWAALLGDAWVRRKAESQLGSFTIQMQTYGPLKFSRRQALFSFFALSLGVFSIFAVGLNRQSYSDKNNRDDSGEYTLWCECSVPVYHDLNTAEGRKKLGLQDLPEDVEIQQALCYQADDASCLNLNQVQNPSVLGIDLDDASSQGVSVDEESLLWSMGKQVGDTLHYTNSLDQDVALPIVASIPTGVFQGYALMDRKQFLKVWPDQTGTRLMLIRTKPEQTENVRMLIAQALSEYGVRVMTTGQRMEQFYEVVNTYLSIFLMLGGIGVLVGIFSFIIVVRKNLQMRRSDIRLYKILGYTDQRIEDQLYRENIIVPFYAIFVGVIAAAVSVMASVGNAHLSTIFTAIAFLLLFLWVVKIWVRRVVRRSVILNQ